MKNTRKFICFALCIITIVSMFAACGKKNEPAEEETTITEETTTKEPITIEEPSKETTEKETTKKEETTTKKAESTTAKPYTPPSTTKPKPQVPSTTKRPTQPSTTKKPEPTTTKKPEPTTKPTTTKPTTTLPAETEPKPYSCGKANHHCTTKEEHAFIVSLENKGCSICGSHSCRSFYAIDEWGNNCYDITKCPKYSVKEDPLEYCEHCGKPCGLGDNGSCVRFTVETKCPGCGKKVPAKTCHSH